MALFFSPDSHSRASLLHPLVTMKAIWKFLRSEDGPTAVEYAVMIALIVVTCIGSVGAMAQATADSFDDSAAELNGVIGS